jgi:general secretion pathway protein E
MIAGNMMTMTIPIVEDRETVEARVITYLEGMGYQALKQARRTGKSGLEQCFDILAQKDDGFTLRVIAIEIIGSRDIESTTSAIFNFANKAYDAGIKDRVMVAALPVSEETRELAVKQRIKLIDQDKIETMLGQAQQSKTVTAKPYRFEGKAQLVETLVKMGYHIEEHARVKGRSGVDYGFDILAYANGSRISHSLGIDVFQDTQDVSLEKIVLFDTKAFDTGLDDKAIALLAATLTPDARKFVEHQSIKVLELGKTVVPEKPQEAEKTEKKPSSTGKLLRQAVEPAAVQLIPEVLARRYTAIPLSISGSMMTVAMADPSDILAMEAFSIQSRKRIKPVPATAKEIREAIDFNYKGYGEIEKQISTISIAPTTGENELALSNAATDAPLVQALNLIVDEAVKARASDIHIEPQEKRLRVRYRIDGTLQDMMSLPMDIHPALISRLKILSGLNIADHFRAQDGQFSTDSKQRKIDVRVATSPTVNGEMAVLRLLDKSNASLGLADLGFSETSLAKYEEMLKIPYGMILVSGPTGAGKTTTLYASINSLDIMGRNVITVEDPAEYRFDDINQIQVNNQAGITFATGLRSILRLDPDVILVGEIRDAETANIAVQAALTGHLMLSSIHANDTIGVLFRLIDLGVEPFLISSSVIGIIAQRMVRKICPDCQHTIDIPVAEQLIYEKEIGEKRSKFTYGAGCKTCAYTGYLGRTGIFEILSISDDLRRMLIKGVSSADLRAQAAKDHMVTMLKDGMQKANTGITTPAEVLRTTYSVD